MLVNHSKKIFLKLVPHIIYIVETFDIVPVDLGQILEICMFVCMFEISVFNVHMLVFVLFDPFSNCIN